MKDIPASIQDAINALLQLYGYDIKRLVGKSEAVSEREDRYVSVEDALHFLGVRSRTFLWQYIKAGRIKARKMGKSRGAKVLIYFPSLKQFMEEMPDYVECGPAWGYSGRPPRREADPADAAKAPG